MKNTGVVLDVSSKDFAKSMRLGLVNFTPSASSINTVTAYVYEKIFSLKINK